VVELRMSYEVARVEELLFLAESVREKLGRRLLDALFGIGLIGVAAVEGDDA